MWLVIAVLFLIGLGVVAYVRDRAHNAYLRRQVEVLMQDPSGSTRGIEGLEDAALSMSGMSAHESIKLANRHIIR